MPNGDGDSNHHDNANFMDGIQSMGIVNALKTGDMHVDMLVAMCIPVILRILFSFLGGLSYEKVKTFFLNLLPQKHTEEIYYHVRSILHKVQTDRYDNFRNVDEDAHNQILIKAIALYIHHLDCTFLPTAHLKLTSIESNGDTHYDSDEDDEDEENNTLASLLANYKLVKEPA